MAEITRADLTTADPGEVSDFLLGLGYQSIIVTPNTDGGLVITVADIADVATLTTAMSGFTPTSIRGSYESPIPDRWRTHLAHLRDFRNGIRNGTLSPTVAQRDHVIADVIDLIALVLPRLDTDG